MGFSLNLVKASTKLAYILRHCREPQYISVNGGWATVDCVLEVLKSSFPEMNRTYLEMIVSLDKKGRYSFDDTGDRIRANQGHSIPGVKVDMERKDPPEILYHGTASRFLPAIFSEGLKPMSRQFVHISSDCDTALNVGKRHGDPSVLIVRTGDMARNGYVFYLSFNGVWQTKEVPPEYIALKE